MTSMLGGARAPLPHQDTLPPGDNSASGQSTRCLHKAIQQSIDDKASVMTAALRSDSANDSHSEADSEAEIEPDGEKRGPLPFLKRRRQCSGFDPAQNAHIFSENIRHIFSENNNPDPKMLIWPVHEPSEALIVRACQNQADWNLACRETNWRAKFKPRWRLSGFRSEQHFRDAINEQNWEEQQMKDHIKNHPDNVIPIRRWLDS